MAWIDYPNAPGRWVNARYDFGFADPADYRLHQIVLKEDGLYGTSRSGLYKLPPKRNKEGEVEWWFKLPSPLGGHAEDEVSGMSEEELDRLLMALGFDFAKFNERLERDIAAAIAKATVPKEAQG